MDSLLLPTPEPDNWVEQFAASLQAQRDGAREFMSSHLARLKRAEDELDLYLRRLEDEPPSAAKGPAERAADEEYHRRYEMALDDLRDLKAKHAELQRQLDEARSKAANHAGAGPARGGVLDWEAEKRRILAALETDFEQTDPAHRTERLKIERVIKSTDNVVAEKNREIEELRRRLESQGEAESRSEQPAATDQVIDDAVVREERLRLAQLQEQWREKLRQAEIELSVERAKLARWHAELQDRAKTLPAEKPAAPNLPENVEQPASGRWLARLGLTEADRERRKRI